MACITAATKLIALLGHPVAHSLSPAMQNAALRVCGVPAVYLAFDVTPSNLPEAVGALRALNALGANVTLPHKQAIIPLLDAVEPQAARIGSVNTVVNRDGHLVGHNTDSAGFLGVLRSQWHGSPSETGVLLLGAGGAARAVAAALADWGVAGLLLWNRTPQRAEELAQAVRNWGLRNCRVVTADGLREAASTAGLIINATSAGICDPNVKDLGLADDIFHEGQFVMDLRYGGHTLVTAARDSGAVVMDGWEMLVQQAVLSFELWTGAKAPGEAMRAAAPSAE
ncbi:MAG: shikimate dehydrogenase [Gaiellales bacterium]|nr:shikimate dehydrogenase [Gaiellales bacterium]